MVKSYESKLAADAQQNIMDRKAELLDQELDKFLNGINTSKYRTKTDTWMGLQALRVQFRETPWVQNILFRLSMVSGVYLIYRIPKSFLRQQHTCNHY